MGCAFVPDQSARHPLRCRLLGSPPHCLDSYRPGSGRGHSLESQTTEEPLLFASHLDQVERFFGRVFLFFHLQRPPLSGWSTVARQVALTYTATIIVALAAQQAGRPDLIRSPKRVLAHTWEGL
jgi:hypothetical protein